MTEEILLLGPPCDGPYGPAAALPQLAGHLRRQGLPVRAVDANAAFFRHHFTDRALPGGLERGADRLEALASRKSLSFGAMMEYLALAKAALVLRRGGPELVARALDRDRKMAGSLRSLLFESLSRFIDGGTFPESLWNVGEAIFYEGGSPYGTDSVLEGVSGPSLFGDFFETFVDGLTLSRPRLAGISVTYASQAMAAFRLARALKGRFPGLFVVLGGAFVTLHLSRTERTDFFRLVDGLAVGDGERTLEKAYAVLGARGDLATVPGLVFVRRGELVRVPPAPPTPLEATGPEWSDFPEEDYYRDGSGDVTGFRLSRGCSWARCAFCRTEEAFIAHRDRVDRAHFARLKELLGEGGRSVAFGDDEADADLLEAFSRWVLDEGLSFGWTVNARIGPGLTLERCRLFRRAGCRRLVVGIESLDDALLALMRKGTTVSLIERTLSNLAWAGLPVGAYMIAGFPTETENRARRSFERIGRLRDEGLVSSVFYSAFQIAPGSAVAERPEDFGITAIRYPCGADLNPPAVDFEGPGMSRQRAFALCQDFGASFQRRTPPEEGVPESVVVGARRIRLTFPLDEVAGAIRRFAPPHLDFFGYIERGEAICPPLKRP
ncbi:MAG: B12-binding domain-containing radical SAM protein [Synergistaceae bacterium]|nr:B12-binding domain-containing radical SAM protein [Synergistaceae bacterium]